MKHVDIYTDGACRGNPGRGGYGVILVYNQHRKELSGGDPETTNNRMELLAAIEGLSALREACEVTLYSDSKYLVEAVNAGWLRDWERQNFRRGKTSEVKNIDLWEQLLSLLSRHTVEFVWVKGHDGHPENERCDLLATAAADAFLRKDGEDGQKTE